MGNSSGMSTTTFVVNVEENNNVMDLLPQVKVKFDQKDSREKEVFRKILAARKSQSQEEPVNTVLDNANAEKVRIKADLEKFRAKAEKRKSDLLGEILALEKKRDRIMEPFYQIKFEAQEMVAAAQNYDQKIKAEAKKVNAKRDELNEREQWLNEREEALLKKE